MAGKVLVIDDEKKIVEIVKGYWNGKATRSLPLSTEERLWSWPGVDTHPT